jgi:hypothetical protein
MKKIAIFTCLVFAVIVSMLSGCGVGSYQARSVDVNESPLVNPAVLAKGADDQALYRYVSPKADIRQYTKMMINPVLVYKYAELDKEDLENFQKLANNAYVYLLKELEKSYQIVKFPEPGALQIQMAIVDADSSKPVRNTLSTIVPVGMVLSVVKYAATGKQMGVGEITLQMRITDSNTGELLGAALDRRVGGKELTKLWSSWDNADDALQYWAKMVGFRLCEMRGGTNCVKP